jgi:hypothetical protein
MGDLHQHLGSEDRLADADDTVEHTMSRPLWCRSSASNPSPATKEGSRRNAGHHAQLSDCLRLGGGSRSNQEEYVMATSTIKYCGWDRHRAHELATRRGIQIRGIQMQHAATVVRRGIQLQHAGTVVPRRGLSPNHAQSIAPFGCGRDPRARRPVFHR